VRAVRCDLGIGIGYRRDLEGLEGMEGMEGLQARFDGQVDWGLKRRSGDEE
jgi:hypothetical protein